jgi:hypothetical protein
MGQLLEHFTKAVEDEKEHGVTNDTRAMVFCSYRECVLDIVVRNITFTLIANWRNRLPHLKAHSR